MKTRSQRIQEYKASHPVQQSFHTGKWGFHRYLDGFDLSRCKHGSRKAAEMARAKAADQDAAMQEYYEAEADALVPQHDAYSTF